MALTQIKSSNITDGTIVNADVSASAAIASTKLSGVESGLTSVQTFTVSGTWTKPTGITKVIIEVQGGGGSGGKRNATTSSMGGGGGGGYARKFLDVSSISTSTITVGVGGVSQTTNDTNGITGGASSWADGTNTITGNGGTGGEGTSAYGRKAGGTGVGGDFNIQGGSGTAGGGSNRGGDSFYGTGGMTIWIGQMTSDVPSGYGGGSGGAYQLNSDAGTPGIVYVQEYK